MLPAAAVLTAGVYSFGIQSRNEYNGYQSDFINVKRIPTLLVTRKPNFPSVDLGCFYYKILELQFVRHRFSHEQIIFPHNSGSNSNILFCNKTAKEIDSWCELQSNKHPWKNTSQCWLHSFINYLSCRTHKRKIKWPFLISNPDDIWNWTYYRPIAFTNYLTEIFRPTDWITSRWVDGHLLKIHCI